MRAFVRGLHDGAPGMPQVRGAVFVVGLDQRLADTSVYKATMKGFLMDAPFCGGHAGRCPLLRPGGVRGLAELGCAGSSRNERARYLND